MPTKTDRILSYLPSTFSALPRPSALYWVVDAFGNELLLAENSLAAVMTAHWVDHADKGAELINDLACIAALYGLAPRGAENKEQTTGGQSSCGPVPSEESVEEFREHLKRYVRTFLEGTVTVQGILRVTAETLGLVIADDYDKMDTWWTRKDEALIDDVPRGDDAASLLFEQGEAVANGEPARPARITGKPDLRGGVDLRDTPFLKLKVDAGEPLEINLTADANDPTAVTLDEIARAINAKTGLLTASQDVHHLMLSSSKSGPAGRLEILEIKGDASLTLLGVAPRAYAGLEATRAEITGTVDLSGSIDLSETRYLRVAVDEKLFAEIDVAATDATETTLDDIREAINDALGAEVASHDGHFLKLASPTTGLGSRIALQQAAAQDARERLFGEVEFFRMGGAARRAAVVGASDLSGGADLSQRSKLRIGIDAAPALVVDCAGFDPGNTSLDEIVDALNARLGPGTASHDGSFVTLTSQTTGPDSAILVERLDRKEDASEIILGIGPRLFQGATATAARLAGKPGLGAHQQGLDLGALHTLLLAVDGGPFHEIDLRGAAANPRAATPENIIDAINGAVGQAVASYDGQRLLLTSPTLGGASRIALKPVTVTRRRRFVTRAFILNEAAQAILGFVSREARGSEATRARIAGGRDLSRGVDLREARHLRIVVDNFPAAEIDCAGERPRATTLGEIVKAINSRFDPLINPPDAHNIFSVASPSADGQHLVLTSPTTGLNSRIAFEQARATDAAGIFFGNAPLSVAGREATRVTFVGAADLGEGVDLSSADRVKISIDGGPPVEIACASKLDAKHTRPDEIALAINLALGTPAAFEDGARVTLVSPLIGSGSSIEFAIPEGPDATKAIFGISPPRAYHGANKTAARLVGSKKIEGKVDLSVARFLRIEVDGGQPFDVDCAARAASPDEATLSEVVDAINDAFKAENAPASASQDGLHLILTTTGVGINARLRVLAHTAGDAFAQLMGDVQKEVSGGDAAPAVIEGSVDMLTPVDLVEGRTLRLATTSRGPVDIDVAGARAGETSLDEIISKINAVFPGMASATAEDRLRLTAPARGTESWLSVAPVRVLELVEYPARPKSHPPAADPPLLVRHGDPWDVNNEGATDAELRIELISRQGSVGPKLVNRTTGRYIHILEVLHPGERLEIWRDSESRLRAAVCAADGKRRSIPGSRIHAGPLRAEAFVPFKGRRILCDSKSGDPDSLQLNNPLADHTVTLIARSPGQGAGPIHVRVKEAKLPAPATPPVADGGPVELTGRLSSDDSGYGLVDSDGAPVARLRAGAGVDPGPHADHVVAVYGRLHGLENAPPLMVVERVAELFDVTLRREGGKGGPNQAAILDETFPGVTIGADISQSRSLPWQINFGPSRSQLVSAAQSDKGSALLLPRGRSQWTYLDCCGARFDQARFSTKARPTYFAGARCDERAVFNISRFAAEPYEPEATVFSYAPPLPDPQVEVRLKWLQHQPGAFKVNLPLDLPERFGSRFNQARFGQGQDSDELYENVFTEPEPSKNKDHVVTRINFGDKSVKRAQVKSGSGLIEASVVKRVPLGFEAVTMPFRKPRNLTLGADGEKARIYLAEKDVAGFIELSAREPGEWGNSISVTARKSGPARFEVTVSYRGARFENARRTVLGGESLPTLAGDILRPGPVGVLQAKAAGVEAEVSRELLSPYERLKPQLIRRD